MPEKINADFDSVLAELYAKRDEIEVSINTILFLKGSGSTATSAVAGGGAIRSTTNGGAIPSNAFFKMSLGDAAKKYIELSQAKRTLQQIVKGLEEGGMPPQKTNTVYAALRRRESVTGDIEKVGEEWGLKEWFSGISTGKVAKAPNGKKGKKKKRAKKSNKRTATVIQAAATEGEKPEEPQQAKPEKSPKPISIRDAANAVLVKEDAPLHAEVLAERINKEHGKTTNQKALAASLKDDGGKRFDNIGHNTWVLHDWPEEKKQPKAATATA